MSSRRPFLHEMGEYTGDYNELVYLRARYYVPGMGRFLTKDTWEGNDEVPQSLNHWNYVQSNPISYTDPTGHVRSCPFTDFFSNAVIGYLDENVHLPKSIWLNTYVTAGIGVQCWSEIVPNNDPYDGRGPAQITNKENTYSYGTPIFDQGNFRGFGLLCYIVAKVTNGMVVPCTICASKEYMDQHYKHYTQEMPHDQYEMQWATEYMRRRLTLAIDACLGKKCGLTDVYITAALAQNSPGFTSRNFKGDVTKLEDSERQPGGVNMNWNKYFEKPGNALDTSFQLRRFTNVVLLLMGNGWYVPNINWAKVTELSAIGN